MIRAVFCGLCILIFTNFALTMDHSKLTQHAKICLLRIQGKSVAEAHQELLRLHPGHALSLSTMRCWFRKFDCGIHDFSIKKTGGRLTKVTNEKLDHIRHLLDQDNMMCLRVISCETGLSLRTVHNVLRNTLKLKKRPAKWIPHLLTDNQKVRRLCGSRDLLARFRRSPTLADRVITGDESWFWCYQPQTKRSTLAWLRSNERRLQKPVQDCYVRKVMVIVFWDSQGVVHREFMADGRGINAAAYLQTMRDLREKIRCRRGQLWRHQSFWIHHDGAPVHHSALVWQFLANTNTKILPHPPYSPDLAPSDYFLFNRLKKSMRGEVFQSVEELKRCVDFEIGQVVQWEFRHALRDSWTKRLQLCVQSGDYFEKWLPSARVPLSDLLLHETLEKVTETVAESVSSHPPKMSFFIQKSTMVDF